MKAAAAAAIGTAVLAALAPSFVQADDFLTASGSNMRHGYLPNAGLDPNIVGSNAFGQLFSTSLPAVNGIPAGGSFASPLVYTLPSTGKQAVFVATTNNNVYTLDAGTGTVLKAVNVDRPFNITVDIPQCGDITSNVGVVGTPAIDPVAGVGYFFSKTYLAGTGPGMYPKMAPVNGRYHLHALKVDGLAEVNGYPVDLEGIVAENDPRRVFQGGIALQRPGVLFQNGVVYAAFGSHCDSYNYTGWVMAFEASTGNLISAIVTDSDPNSQITSGGSGVWMSGGGIAADSAHRLFIVTGNGEDSPTRLPRAGSSPPGQLGMAAINCGIDASGKLHTQDFFLPYNYEQLNLADRDFGSGGMALFPQGGVFGTPAHPKLSASVGKTGLVYVMDADNLGGFAQGPSGSDGVLTTIALPGSMFGTVALYPGVQDGGYMYAIPAGSPLQAYKYSASGDTIGFSLAGQTTKSLIGFSGSPVVTSLNGAAGSAIVWYMDWTGSLNAFKAVPQNNALVALWSGSVGGGNPFNKFARPAFSQGSVYLATSDGRVMKFGSPLLTPLTAQAVDFGKVVVGVNTSVQPVNFVVGPNPVTLTALNISDPSWTVTNAISFPVQLAAKATYPISLTFNPSAPGSFNAVVNLTVTVNGFKQFAIASIHGAALANGPELVIQPVAIDFGGVVTNGSPTTANAVVLNDGSTDLVITSVTYPASTRPFSVLNPPALPYTLPSSQTLTLSVKFYPTADGVYSDNVIFNSNGGSKSLLLTGSAAGPPVLQLQTQRLDGTYTSSLNVDFGSNPMGAIVTLNVLVSNVGKSNLLITKCKPPYAGAIQAAQNAIFEQEVIAPGNTVTVPVTFKSPTVNPYVVGSQPQVFTAPWELNTNDPASTGVTQINFVARQAFPQVAGWASAGCVIDSTAARTLGSQFTNTKGTVEACLASCAPYAYGGLEYGGECWCGNKLLNTTSGAAPASDCNMSCSGNQAEICGAASRLSLYVRSSTPPSTSTGTNPASPSSTATSNPTPPAGWVYRGCYSDPSGGPRTFNQLWGNTYTTASCLTKGASAGQTLCGLEYGSECWCDTQWRNVTVVDTPESNCNMPCSEAGGTGNCGAGWFLSVYEYTTKPVTTSKSISTTSAATSTAAPSTTATSNPTPPAGWVSRGCYSDPSGGPRTLGKLFGNTYTTASCLAQGASSGLTLCGLEYGSECWCDTQWRNVTVVDAPDSKCNMPCSAT
ncbi:hypothetical protein HK101_003899, partial [Irineochytrium annulatum]